MFGNLVKILIIGGVVIGVTVGVSVGGYLCWTHWSRIIHEVAVWARKRGYESVIRVLCQVEEVRAGIRRVTIRFLGPKEQTAAEDAEVITEREICESELPEEFRKVGVYILEINPGEATYELS